MLPPQSTASTSELLDTHLTRLHKLELTAARLGDETPPHVLTEIERIEGEISQLRAAASTKVSSTLVEALGPTGRYQLWMSHIMRLDTDIGRLNRAIERLSDRVDKVLLAIVKKVADVDE